MTEQEMSDDEAIKKIAEAMKENSGTQEEKQNIHTFLHNVAIAKNTTKVGNLRDDKELSELGYPNRTVRGSFDLARISKYILNNKFLQEYFNSEAEDTLATSLSRAGFLVKQATTNTKQIADVTKKRKINKGMFGSKKIEETGGDTSGAAE